MKVKVSFHGHSTHSDGIDSIEKLVKKAYALEMDYFGISDHNTTDHIKPFYTEIEKINNQGDFQIIPVCAVEVALFKDRYKKSFISKNPKKLYSDIIFAKPGAMDPDFIRWLDLCIANRHSIKNVQPLIETAVKMFNAVVVIPHPDMPAAPSINFTVVENLEANLSPKIKKNVAVEVRNWSANVFFKNKRRENNLIKALERFDFAQVGMADYHCAHDIVEMYSLAEVEQKTADQLVKAFQNRKIWPKDLAHPGSLKRARIALHLSRALVRTRFLPKYKRDRLT